MKKILSSLLLSFFIIGCGDNSGTDDLETLGSAIHTPYHAAYIFDSLVEGVTYANAGYSDVTGTTGSDGKLYYVSDTSSLSFKVGGITLGSILPSSINSDKYITIAELLGNSRSITTYDTKMKNMLQLLQSLDSNSNPMDGITISSNTRSSMANMSYDFSSNTYDNATLSSIVTTLGFSLLNSNYAIANYEESLRSTLNSTIDTVVPAPPTVTTSTSNLVTANDTLSLTIRGEKGSTVYVGGTAVSGVIDSTRLKVVTIPSTGTLSEGNNTYNITLNDGTIGESDPYTLIITKDTIAPVFTSNSTVTVNENLNITNAFYTAITTDATTRTYSLTAGDTGSFTIDSSSGDLKFSSQPDYETKTSYSVTISATDLAGNSATLTLTVNITNVNDTAPTITTTSLSAINENTTAVGTIVYTDEDDATLSNATYTCSLSGTNASSFSITNGGVLSFNSAPDYETQSTYYVTVTVSDGVQSGSKSYTISITNLDDTAPDITSNSFSINENYTSVGTVTVSDPDGIYTSMTYAIGGADGGKFSISSAGLLSFNSAPDYETPTDSDSNNIYSANVTVTDSGGNSVTEVVNVTVANVNDKTISFTTLPAISVTAGASSTTIAATDDFTPYYTVIEDSTIGCGYNLFSIGGTNGQLTFKNTSSTFQTTGCNGTNIYKVKVKAYSSTTDYVQETFTITVN